MEAVHRHILNYIHTPRSDYDNCIAIINYDMELRCKTKPYRL